MSHINNPNYKKVHTSNAKACGHHFFIHNALGSFYKGLLNWFAEEFYCNIQYKVIGTYEKSVEFFNKCKETGGEINAPILPSLTLDPSLDFQQAEIGGRFLWQSQYLAPGLGGKLFDSIDGLQGQDSRASVVFSKYEGEIELTFWLESVYELLDLRVELLQFCSGYGRRIRPTFFDSFIVLPDELVDVEVEPGVPFDWSNTDLMVKLLEAPNVMKSALPVILTPQMWINSISDNSTKYGGDTVAEWKLSVNVGFEIDLPTYVVLYCYLNPTINLEFRLGATHSRYGKEPEVNPETGEIEKSGEAVDEIPRLRIYADDPSIPTFESREVQETFIYSFSTSDLNLPPGENVVFPHPYPGVDIKDLILVSYIGELSQGQDWDVINNGDDIEIFIEPKEDEVVEVIRYVDSFM